MKYKVDIGSGAYPDYGTDIIVENGFDSSGDVKEMIRWIRQETEWYDGEIVIADGNCLPFKDDSIDEVFSSHCVGLYVTDYEDIVRVMKPRSRIMLNVWSNEDLNVVDDVVKGLRDNNVEIIEVDVLNEDIDGVPYDSIIDGFKEG